MLVFYVSEGEGHDRRKLQTAAILICLTAKGGDNPPSAHTEEREGRKRGGEGERGRGKKTQKELSRIVIRTPNRDKGGSRGGG